MPQNHPHDFLKTRISITVRSFRGLRDATGRSLRQHTPKFLKSLVLEYLIPEETSLIFALVHGDLDRVGPGIMFDVGVGHGTTFEPFARLGWRVFGFEPDPANRRVAQELARAHPNVFLDGRAVSNSVQRDAPFYRSDISDGISGLSRFDASHRREGTVSVTTLSEFCAEHNIDHIDYLKIDAEGFDFFVLKGAPWNRLRPQVIMCEFEDQKTLPLGYSFREMAEFLDKKGYRILVSEWGPVAKRGGPHTWWRFVRYPDASLEGAAWGNMIAVLDDARFERLLRRASSSVLRWKIGNWIWKFWAFLTHG